MSGALGDWKGTPRLGDVLGAWKGIKVVQLGDRRAQLGRLAHCLCRERGWGGVGAHVESQMNELPAGQVPQSWLESWRVKLPGRTMGLALLRQEPVGSS